MTNVSQISLNSKAYYQIQQSRTKQQSQNIKTNNSIAQKESQNSALNTQVTQIPSQTYGQYFQAHNNIKNSAISAKINKMCAKTTY